LTFQLPISIKVSMARAKAASIQSYTSTSPNAFLGWVDS
jgi:hypothetical protein